MRKLIERIKNFILRRSEKERVKRRLKRLLAGFGILFGVLVVSVVFHNLLSGISGRGDWFFFSIAMVAFFVMPFYVVYGLFVVSDIVARQYFTKRKISFKHKLGFALSLLITFMGVLFFLRFVVGGS